MDMKTLNPKLQKAQSLQVLKPQRPTKPYSKTQKALYRPKALNPKRNQRGP